MNKLTMNGEIQNFRPDVTFPCSVQKKTRHSCSLNREWTRMTQVFCRNTLPSWKQSYRWPKSPKNIFTERLAISLTYSSFGFKLGVFPTYNSEQIALASLRQQSHEFDFGSQLHKSQRETHQLIRISNSTDYQLEMRYFFHHSYIILSRSKCAYFFSFQRTDKSKQK